MALRRDDVAGGGGSPMRTLFGPFRGEIAHDRDPQRRLWTWSVWRDGSSEPVAEGFAYDERDAEVALDEWARRHRPRGLRGRLRRSA